MIVSIEHNFYWHWLFAKIENLEIFEIVENVLKIYKCVNCKQNIFVKIILSVQEGNNKLGKQTLDKQIHYFCSKCY